MHIIQIPFHLTISKIRFKSTPYIYKENPSQSKYAGPVLVNPPGYTYPYRLAAHS